MVNENVHINAFPYGNNFVGLPHGEGTLTHPLRNSNQSNHSTEESSGFRQDQDEYVGHWEAGQRCGHGIQVWGSAGSKYEGEWKDNRRQGQGTLEFGDSCTYTGSWNLDQYDGEGMVQSEQSSKLADMSSINLFALGEFISGNIIYRGTYASGRQEGTGSLRYADGSVYIGEFKNNTRHGKGVYVYDIPEQVRYCHLAVRGLDV